VKTHGRRKRKKTREKERVIAQRQETRKTRHKKEAKKNARIRYETTTQTIKRGERVSTIDRMASAAEEPLGA
jgi:hypothetical protein